ncbi:DUF1702 family protein [Haloechinothrix sp. LS1_15]|uniref:DUF1702 family protein n=1 Tax=Haloechinothrix sp. LS1_15 TaxID=2652248 RepID=UPI002945BCDF|nr:DUF1702 family protein [Haloechinothrix sp. LS1_15]MDV6014725.1 DUF1702 family protein [Haloechinothrix sp. LS1_15]
MATAERMPAAATAEQPRPPRLLKLPAGLANFSRRGFRLDQPEQRELLEGHARSFLAGFNLAVRHWRDPHPALATIGEAERGFAYEGAAMHAALRDRLTAGRAHAFRRLLAGSGDGYVHLVHVGFGWAGALPWLPLPSAVPGTPLLRWLALDGAGFAEVYFGGPRSLRRAWRHDPAQRRTQGRAQRWEARLAGCGRALWFVESANVAGAAERIAAAPEIARGPLWSGIGLACCYAGGAGAAGVAELAERSGRYWPHLGQGALFGLTARARSGVVPAYTAMAGRELFGIEAAEAREWTDLAAEGLTDSLDVSAYDTWKSRLRAMVSA